MMKKYITLFLSICIISLFACNEDSDEFKALSFTGKWKIVMAGEENGEGLSGIDMELVHEKDAYYALTVPDSLVSYGDLEIKFPFYLKDISNNDHELQLRGGASVMYGTQYLLSVEAVVANDSIHVVMTDPEKELDVQLFYEGVKK